jgi:conjugal transfer pilus assembly protein TraU
MSYQRNISLISLVAFLSAINPLVAFGDTTDTTESKTGSESPNTGSGKQCPSAGGFFKNMIKSVCWTCLYPVKLAGKDVMGSGDMPEGSSNTSVCQCNDKLGVPKPGTTAAMWQPYRIIEVVRTPGCSPILGGKILFGSSLQQGGFRADPSNKYNNFYHFNWYAMPLFTMLSLFTSNNCNAGSYKDFDLIYPSRLDPTWDDDALAMFTTPETVMFANPFAIMACAVDCGIVSSSSPRASDPPGTATNANFWCAGCWGGIYPYSGNFDASLSPVTGASLVATRALGMMHRRGLAHKTVGQSALCGGTIFPTLYKSQYKLQMTYPIAESAGRCCHQIGETPFKWGEWRNIPGIGEDYIQIVWRYTQCCLTL